MPKRSRSCSSGYSKKARYSPKSNLRYKKGRGATKYRDPKAKTSETKVNDFFVNGSVSYNTAAFPLMGIAQGNDNTNRIGRQIRVKSVHVKCQVSNLASILNASPFIGGTDSVRIAVVVDKNNSDITTYPIYSDVWQTAGSNVLMPFMPRNMNNIDRFDVLSDELVTINAGGAIGVSYSKYIKLDLRSVYNATTGIQPATNGIYCFVLDQNPGTASTYTQVMGTMRLTFFDD